MHSASLARSGTDVFRADSEEVVKLHNKYDGNDLNNSVDASKGDRKSVASPPYGDLNEIQIQKHSSIEQNL